MKRVLVIGCPGSGKSHFSQRLAELTNLPLIHLDSIYHQDIWSPDANRKKEQWRDTVREFTEGPSWIIDGNYKSTFDIRFPAADAIIFLDYPRWLSLSRTLLRQWNYRKTLRPDMPEGWRERLSPDFLSFIWSYRRKERPRLLELLQELEGSKTIHIFESSRQTARFLENFPKSG